MSLIPDKKEIEKAWEHFSGEIMKEKTPEELFKQGYEYGYEAGYQQGKDDNL